MRNASRLPFGTIDRYPPKIEGSLPFLIKKTVTGGQKGQRYCMVQLSARAIEILRRGSRRFYPKGETSKRALLRCFNVSMFQCYDVSVLHILYKLTCVEVSQAHNEII